MKKEGKNLPVSIAKYAVAQVAFGLIWVGITAETSYLINNHKDAKDLSVNLAGQVVIGFPDYNKLLHEEIVNSSKLSFQDTNYTKTVKVINFTNPIDIL